MGHTSQNHSLFSPLFFPWAATLCAQAESGQVRGAAAGGWKEEAEQLRGGIR